MNTVRLHLVDLNAAAPTKPPGYLEAVLAVSRIEGHDVLISHADYLQLRARYRDKSTFGAGIGLRTDADQAAALAVCATCPELSDGRCRACRLCGGQRQVTNLVKLNINRCPLKKW